LGDPDQLASVEAGAVLGDVCAAPALRPAVARLRRSHRFDPTRGVGALARAIREGQADQAVAALRDPAHARELRWSSLPRGEALGADLQALIVAGYRPLLKAVWPEQALAQMERFRVLCAHRRGLHGVEGLNRLIEQALTDARLIRPIGRWYAGRPVMITVNDYALQLYNGDVGIILPDPVDRSLRAFFPGSDGALRGISPARLPAHETVWAMSIHKSQGSEFNEVAVVLPDRPSPLLTRELIYTAVTRARDAVHLYAPEEELRLAIGRRVQRASGLVEALGSA
jgi:exodeoxyribonuclease V alpha subunit